MSLSDYKDTIHQVYIEEDRTLDDLMRFMNEEYSIVASKDTYKRFFRTWGFRKNKKSDIWTWANHRIEKRRPQKKTDILVNGVAIDEKKVRKEISRHVSTFDHLNAAAASPATPENYSIATPQGCPTPGQPRIEQSTQSEMTPTVSHSAQSQIEPNGSDNDGSASSSEVIIEDKSQEHKLLAQVMEDCGSLIGLWGRTGIRLSRSSLRSSYNTIAEWIVRDDWSAASPSRDISRLLPVGDFDLLHSTYRNDIRRVQLQMPHLTRSAGKDITRTARFIASAKGCVDVAAALFSTQADVDSRDSKGQTCLHLAVAHNHPEMVSFLIARDADVNGRRSDGETVWTQICTSAEHERVSQLLIEAGADVNILVDDIANPLYPIAAAGRTDDLRLLLQRGVNPSIKTMFDWTPLHWAAHNGHPEVVKLLVEAGADVNSVSDTGLTPLRLMGKSTASKENDIIEFLKQHGAVINVKWPARQPSSQRRARRKTRPSSSSKVTRPRRPKSVTPFDGAAGSTQSNAQAWQGVPSQTAASIQPSPALSIRSIPAPSPASVFSPRETGSMLSWSHFPLSSPDVASPAHVSAPASDIRPEISNDPPMPPPVW